MDRWVDPAFLEQTPPRVAEQQSGVDTAIPEDQFGIPIHNLAPRRFRPWRTVPIEIVKNIALTRGNVHRQLADELVILRMNGRENKVEILALVHFVEILLGVKNHATSDF